MTAGDFFSTAWEVGKGVFKALGIGGPAVNVDAPAHMDAPNVRLLGDEAIPNALNAPAAQQFTNATDREMQRAGETFQRNANNATDAGIANAQTLTNATAGAAQMGGEGALLAGAGGGLGAAAAGGGMLAGGILGGAGSFLQGRGEGRLRTAQGQAELTRAGTQAEVAVDQNRRAAEREAIPLAAERRIQHYRELRFKVRECEAEEQAASTRAKKGLLLLWTEISDLLQGVTDPERARVLVSFVVEGDDLRFQLVRLLYEEDGFFEQAERVWPGCVLTLRMAGIVHANRTGVYPHGDLCQAQNDYLAYYTTPANSRTKILQSMCAFRNIGVSVNDIQTYHDEVKMTDHLSLPEKADLMAQMLDMSDSTAGPSFEQHITLLLNMNDMPDTSPIKSVPLYIWCDFRNIGFESHGNGKLSFRHHMLIPPSTSIIGLECNGLPLATIQYYKSYRYGTISSHPPRSVLSQTITPTDQFVMENPQAKRIVVNIPWMLRGVGMQTEPGAVITTMTGEPYKRIPKAVLAEPQTPPTPAPPYQATPPVAAR